MTENNGWIKIHRKLLNNAVCSKPNYLAVWMYILLKANHDSNEMIWNNRKVVIKPGSFIGSLRKIARYFNISISTVKYIVEYLKSEQMIEHKANKKFSVFTVLNWGTYQGYEQAIEHKENTRKTQGKTNKKEENDKKDKKRECTPTQKYISIFNEIFNTSYTATSSLKPYLEFWLREYSLPDIEKALRASATHHFYKDKMKPITLLRKHEDRIGEMLNYKPEEKKVYRFTTIGKEGGESK